MKARSWWSVAIAGVLATCVSVSATADEFNRESAIEGAKKEGKFVWYTGAPQALATVLLKAFGEKYPFLDVSEYYLAPAGRLQARLKAEMEAGKYFADVLHSGDPNMFVEMRDELATFITPEQDAYAAEYKDEGVWTSWRLTTIGMAYSPAVLGSADVPTSWWDLADPRFEGQFALQDANAGTMFVQWYVLREALGSDFWPAIGRNKPVVYTDLQPMVEGVLRGEIKVNAEATSYLNWAYGVRDGAPYKGIYPKEGVPVAIQPIAVLKDAPHPNAARLFVDWILSAEGQTIMVETLGDYSPRLDVHPPEGSPPLSEIKTLVPPSPTVMLPHKAEFSAQWADFTKP